MKVPKKEDYKFTWIIIPPYIHQSSELNVTEKYLAGTILGLTNKKGYCYASNAYLANSIGKQANTVSIVISSLAEKGILKVEVIRDETNRVVERRIYPVSPLPYENQIPPSEKSNTPPSEKSKYIYKDINNKDYINTSETRPNGHARCPLEMREKYPELARLYPKGHHECIEYIDSCSQGKKFPNYAKQIFHLHAMLKAGYNFPEIDEIINRLEADNFWKMKGWDLAIVANEIGKVRAYIN